MKRVAAVLALVACSSNGARTSAPMDERTPHMEERWAALMPAGPTALTVALQEGEPLVLVAAAGVQALADDGRIVAAPWLQGLPDAVDLDVDHDALWVAEADKVHRLDARTKLRKTLALPAGVTASSIAAGYGDTVFVGDVEHKTIHVVSDAGATQLAEADARALVVSGGSLFAGGASDLVAIDLASGKSETIAGGVGTFEGLALDHLGYAVAAVRGRGVVRIAPDGTITDLAPAPTGPVAFVPKTRSLLVADGTNVVALDYLALTGEDASIWHERDRRLMAPFDYDGIVLAGAEYWPYRGDKEPDYPADVLWGFYPEEGVVFEGDRSPAAATPAAIACAEKSYLELAKWADSPPPAFARAVEQGASSRFYLWVNDYSEASSEWPHRVRPGRFWYWERKPAVAGRVPGYWKWETTLAPDGKCQIPQAEQIDAYLDERTHGASVR